MGQAINNGIIDKLSHHSVGETVEKLKGILQSEEVALFAMVDHSSEAEKVGMKMRPTKLLIFGSQGGHAANASRAQRGDRSSAQDSGLGGRAGKSLGFLQ